MGLFDFFKGKGGGSADERTIQKHAERVMDKRAMSPDRFASIEFLCKLGTPEAWRAALARYNFSVDPSITDREEKQYIFEAVVGSPEKSVEPVREFLRSASALNWPIKMLRTMLEPADFIGEMLEFLATFDTGYEKNAERKAELIMAVEDPVDERVTAVVLPFLEDFTEDVRFHAVRTLVAQGDETARGPLLKLLLADGSMRIRATVVEGLAEKGWSVDADLRDKVLPLVRSVPTGPWGLDEAGRVVKVAGGAGSISLR